MEAYADTEFNLIVKHVMQFYVSLTKVFVVLDIRIS